VGCANAEALGALLDGQLSATERAQLVDHAAGCEQCRAVIAMFVDAPVGPGREPTLDARAVGEVDDVFAPGEHVGRYVIEQRIGVGGMGVVYAAIDSELQRRVAVKLLRRARDGELGTRGRDRLLREARSLAKLSHPNVVTVFDVGAWGTQLYIAMELVDGGNLSAWLRSAPRSTREILDRLREAGAGLAAAHAAGVVHRDVKPDNILVGNDGRARMTDFGLARSGGEQDVASALAAGIEVSDQPLTRTNALVGTPVYMAPEQLAGKSADARSDQWSFCATLYEAVTGIRPFAVGDLESRRSAIAGSAIAQPARGRRVPRWVRRIVMRGLAADPDARWPSVAAIVDALVRIPRRRRALFAVAGVAAIAAAVIAVMLATRTTAPAARRYFAGPDGRAGCDCPYAACTDHGCVGECDAPGFTLGAPVPGLDAPGDQEALLGASLDGDAILYATGERCAVDRLMIARRSGDTFVPVDITDRMTALLAGGQVMEGAGTLAPDGRSIVIRTPDMFHFVRARLGDADELLDVDGAEFADLTPPLVRGQALTDPVVSSDQLTLYYSIYEQIDHDAGPLNGSYASVRTDLRAPFPRGERLPGRARNYDYVTGVSRDGLALFMNYEYVTRVLVRADPREPFGDPGPTLRPPELYGWRAIPLAGCRRILTTDTPGGCVAEHIVYVEAMPR